MAVKKLRKNANPKICFLALNLTYKNSVRFDG